MPYNGTLPCRCPVQFMKSPLTGRPGAFSMQPAEAGQPASKIRNFIYMSQGNSNSYLVLTEAGKVVINTGMGYEARVHKQLFDEISTAPLRYILLTQGHVDHVGGVAHFREPGTQVIAQAGNPACQRDDERIAGIRVTRGAVFFKQAIERALRMAADNPSLMVQDRPQPDLLFTDRHSFEEGGLCFELYAAPGGETIDSMFVWLPQHSIAFSGNMLGPLFPHFPNFYTLRGDKYRAAEPYLEALDRLRALEPELLITGHFAPIEGRALIRTELSRLRDAVEYVHDKTLQGINQGRDIFELMREIRLPPELQVGEGYGKVSWAVRAVYENYLGWFRMRSTTELYAEPPESVYGELAELAGSDALVQRARKHVEAGRPLHAIHLAEIAQAASEPASTSALQVLLDAHQLLLEASGDENFWEVSWLRRQIEELQAALQQAQR